MSSGSCNVHLPLEAEPRVDADQNERKQHRETALVGQLLADLRSDNFRAPQLDAGVHLLQRIGYRLADGVDVLIRLRQQPHHDAAIVTEVLHLRVVVPSLLQRRAGLLQIRSPRIGEFQLHAAGEIDAEVQAVPEQQHDRRDDRDAGHAVPHATRVHERVRRDFVEELHGAAYS
jgi:hypothetical protein